MIRLPLKFSPQNLRIFGLIVVLICVLLFFATQIHNYLNKDLFIRVSTSVAIMALIAIGQTLVILTRNIDLSVGSVVGFSAFFLGGLLAMNPNINPLLVILAGVGFGSLFGMLNGLLVAYANVPSIYRHAWHHGAVSFLARPVFGCQVDLNGLIATLVGVAPTNERDQRRWLRHPRHLRDYPCCHAGGAFCVDPATRGAALLCCRLKSG